MGRRRNRLLPVLAATLAVGLALPSAASAACCYFSAQNTDILQPAQKVFLTWDPVKQVETFTVQPKFEGNALDFGMVIPTPTQPKLHEMPRDFFKHLAVYSIMKKREFPQSKLLPIYRRGGGKSKGAPGAGKDSKNGEGKSEPERPSVVVLEAGVVGSLGYKIISAWRGADLYKWLKENKNHYTGGEVTCDFYL